MYKNLNLRSTASLTQVKKAITRCLNCGVTVISVLGRVLSSNELDTLIKYYDNSGILATGYGIEYFTTGQTFEVYKKAMPVE